MPAAVADHGVGKGWRRGMVMSHTGEIATLAAQEERDARPLRRHFATYEGVVAIDIGGTVGVISNRAGFDIT